MYDKAKKMRELHLKGSMEQKDTIGIINSLCDIADAYSLNDNYEKALPKIKRALALSRIYGNDRITVNMLSQTARYYNMANLPDSAFLYINEMLRNPSYVENKSKCSIIATAYKRREYRILHISISRSFINMMISMRVNTLVSI